MSTARPRFVSREVGPAVIFVLVIGLAALWALARPAGQSTSSYFGQWLGAESVLLMSIGLVLISTLLWVEHWFDGVDRAAVWHRRVAIVGLLLLAPHVLLASSPNGTALGGALGVIGVSGLVVLVAWAVLPRWQSVVPKPLRRPIILARDAPGIRDLRKLFGGYARWRSVHRLTGLFVAAGFAHGVLDATAFPDSPALRWSYVAIGAVGLAFYVYRELLARHFAPLHDYQVSRVVEIEEGLTEIAMAPLGRRVDFVPGQFAMVHLEGKDGWHRHPFTISSAPREREVRVTIKALGDYTSRVSELIEPGMPAVISRPHGRFSHLKGTARQVWIAGGVGVTPFLSWLRALDGPFMSEVDFFYTAIGEPAFADELRAIADRHDSVHLHLIDSQVEGRLTSKRILAATTAQPRDLSVFMCGPAPMVRSFEDQLRAAGVPGRAIYYEHFDWR